MHHTTHIVVWQENINFALIFSFPHSTASQLPNFYLSAFSSFPPTFVCPHASVCACRGIALATTGLWLILLSAFFLAKPGRFHSENIGVPFVFC